VLRLAVVLAVVLVLVVVSSLISLPYYALMPGDAIPVTGMIQVPNAHLPRLHGKVLLTDVDVAPVRLISYLPYLLMSNVALVPKSNLLGTAPSSQFIPEGEVDMAEAQLTAKVAALRQMGYSVPEHDAGALVYEVVPHTPASHHLAVGDVITSLGSTRVTSAEGLARAIEALRPGEAVELGFTSILSPSLHGHETLRLTSDPSRPGRAFLGVAIYTQPAYSLPVALDLSNDGIGGPSAGLAFTLGILDKLSGGDLTGGHVVAATGTIHPNGTVGPVGGVSEKTIAVEQAGATVFLVPPQEYAKAEAKATPSLHVMPVTSLSEALADLKKLGGHLGRAGTGPPPGPGGHSAAPGWQYDPWS
jgi:PDZ domain-containing protein